VQQIPQYPVNPESVAAILAEISATRGDALAVAILAEAVPNIYFTDSRRFQMYDIDYFNLRLDVAAGLYGRLEKEREDLCLRLSQLASEISRAHEETAVISSVQIAPTMVHTEGWRPNAKAWVRGEGINNQGRVRSDNIAARQHDGLLFRSEPEVLLYDALKAKGVYLAPLPVFLRGGAAYQRLEPDFVLLHKGVVMVVEIDGATVHRESPSEAHARTQGLQRDGVRVERVPATDCSTKQAAERCATKLIEALERYRELRA
jgi:hypothetical protein